MRRPLFSADGPAGRVEVLETEDFGKTLAVEGAPALTEADGFAQREMMVHPPLATHPEVRSALVVGGGDGDLASELLRYTGIERIAVTEDDAAYAEAARQFFPERAAALSNQKVSLSSERADAFIRDTRERFDVILVTARAALREEASGQSFYCDCFRALSGDGILVTPAGGAFFPEGRRELAAVAGRLKRLFPIFRPYSYCSPASGSCSSLLAFASKKYDPLRDIQSIKWEGLGLETRYYDTEVHRAAFALPRYIAEVFRGT